MCRTSQLAPIGGKSDEDPAQELLADEQPNLVMFGDGKVHPPYGLFGGKPGSCNLAFINEGLENARELEAKEAEGSAPEIQLPQNP